MSLRKPCRWATYNGNQTHVVGQLMGPNTLGELLTVVTASYDHQTNKTRLGFAYGVQSQEEDSGD
jgi:hypothetical protein